MHLPVNAILEEKGFVEFCPTRSSAGKVFITERRRRQFTKLVHIQGPMPEKSYDHKQIELKWHERWKDSTLFEAEEEFLQAQVLRARNAAVP